MINRYKEMTQMQSARIIFAGFPYASTIPEEERDSFILQGIKIGEGQAEKIRQKYPDVPPSGIAALSGIKIFYNDEALNEKYVQFAMYKAKNKEIHLNAKAVNFIQRLINDESCKIDEIFIAHELFHFYEMSEIGPVGEKFHMNRKLFGIFNIKQTLMPVREVAANAFCRKLCGIPFEPTVLEKIYFNNIKDYTAGNTVKNKKRLFPGI